MKSTALIGATDVAAGNLLRLTAFGPAAAALSRRRRPALDGIGRGLL